MLLLDIKQFYFNFRIGGYSHATKVQRHLYIISFETVPVGGVLNEITNGFYDNKLKKLLVT